jgi:hypothetical protein
VTVQAEIGVFGGSGFYSFLSDVEEVEVATPYGKPSAPFAIGRSAASATPDTVEERDLEQVRLAIDTMQSLTAVLETFVPEELLKDFTAAVASLQLAYVQAAAEDASAPEPAES